MNPVWASLITNMDYLPGLLTLHHSLNHPQPDPSVTNANTPTPPDRGTRYSFVAFYTSSFPPEGLKILQSRGITAQWVPNVVPASTREYTQDPRFADTWTKLVAFSLEEYERVVLLDGDILVRRNMDELMELELDPKAALEDGTGKRVFAAAHACACNPMKKSHYPAHWIPANCAYTAQHPTPDSAHISAPPRDSGVGMLNSGVLVVTPSSKIYSEIMSALQETERIEKYDFPDQELLSDVFNGRWVALPYVYNALKTLRMENVHGAIWRDEEAKAVHYIFAKKPWHEVEEAKEKKLSELSLWWWKANWERQRLERENGVADAFSG
ncbi:Glycosyl transferase family 8 [Penicillium maclennaniae]|uniref:Glycosyl transferase family 8 n=1 Tax=Penicillium maclennaniae TaxID=1343394 RepID=UPI0025409DCC|nr:Glycosyl transferase family 8 [Penicillium maclennaniae]KAJ5667987.1 Glycosyl transferase family 8 [Penicillium maclennaniae]